MSLASRTHFEVLGLEGQVLKNCPVLGSRTAQFFELLKVCGAPEQFLGRRFFFGDRLKNFCEDLFLWWALALVSLVLDLEHSCPWPRQGLSSEGLSLALASDFFCVLGLGLGFFCVLGLGLDPYVLDSTSAKYLCLFGIL